MAGYGLLPTLPPESRSSEWLGPAGSSARLGTMGEAPDRTQLVETVEDATVTTDDRAEVLHVEVPLEHGLGEITERRQDRNDETEEQRGHPDRVIVQQLLEDATGVVEALLGDRAAGRCAAQVVLADLGQDVAEEHCLRAADEFTRLRDEARSLEGNASVADKDSSNE